MAATYKVLGQSAPSATTAVDLYTVPTGVTTVVSTLVICNRATSDATYRVAVRPSGDALANQHYIAYDVTVRGSDSTNLTIGISLNQSDVITVYGSTANLSFSAFGSEIS
jgi:hypothetical protein